MDSETSDIPRNMNTSGPQTQSRREDEGKVQKRRGSRCLVSITVSLGLVCLLLLILVILQYFILTAEREEMKSDKNKDEELDHTRFCLNDNYTERTLDLESNVTYSSEQLEKKPSKLGGFFTSLEDKSWSESRQFCRDHGGDLVIIKSEEKQRLVSSFVKYRIGVPVWIGLTDTENESIMKWVDNSILNQGFWINGEPSNNDGNEHCVKMNVGPVLKNWNDIPCLETSKFICE